MSSSRYNSRFRGLSGFGLNDCASDIAPRYAGRYVFAGSRVRWQGAGYPHGSPFSDRAAAIRSALGEAFADPQVSIGGGLIAISQTITIEAMSTVDRGDIGDIAANFEATLASLGWSNVQGSVGFVSRPTVAQICGPGGGLQPGPAPGGGGGDGNDTVPVPSFWDNLRKALDPVGSALGIPAEVMVLGAAVLVAVVVLKK